MRKRKSDLNFYLQLVILFFLLIFLHSCGNSKLKSIPNDAIIVCGDSKVLIVEFPEQGDTIPHIAWSWDAQIANDLPFEYRTRKFNSIDDCKSINNGEQLMISSSSGAIAIVNIEDNKVTFIADVPNAHSVEIIPGNKIIAAASTAPEGNQLMLFDINQPSKLLDTDSLYSAHGLVWDNRRNILFALGYDVLREYKINYENKLIVNDEWKIPGISGHDLSISQDGNNLFITEHTGAWIFNIENHSFSKIEQFPDAENIKSINQNKNHLYVYTVAEESWWTYQVKFFNPSGYLSFPNLRVYKARFYNVN
ncbi:MAG TPA: hypothetical protein GXX42_12440 [Petrimonas sp.]|uniref:DUF6528 family protein n=1 Tax=Petrimonas sp. TaxID=2023866 RepID=UPI0009596455|nr:MAG: hypothetical protein BGO33_06075 [Bacteroidia bacterium 43-41]HHV86601.1 hypothetical protein [Petrimonas sp.]